MISMSKGGDEAMGDMETRGAVNPEMYIFQNWAYDRLHMTLQYML